jgi:hypothetical protein
LDPRVRARILGLHAEDPSLSTRKIAAMVGCSRETVRLIVKSASGSPVEGLVARSVAAGVPVPAWQAKWAAREMSEEDHERFDTYIGPPASVWFWGSRP